MFVPAGIFLSSFSRLVHLFLTLEKDGKFYTTLQTPLGSSESATLLEKSVCIKCQQVGLSNQSVFLTESDVDTFCQQITKRFRQTIGLL